MKTLRPYAIQNTSTRQFYRRGMGGSCSWVAEIRDASTFISSEAAADVAKGFGFQTCRVVSTTFAQPKLL
jgi:hypothetical protein